MTDLIITHQGQCHRDDFISVCLLLASLPKDTRVERRDPLPAELDDPNVYVVDVGGRHEPELRNFDHHQFDRDYEPTCALTLVLKHLGVYDTAVKASSWIKFTEVIDSKGPKVAADYLEMSQDRLIETLSPVEAQVLRLFAIGGELSDQAALLPMMKILGETWLRYWAEFDARWKTLSQVVKIHSVMGLEIAVNDILTENDPYLAFNEYVQDNHPDVAITITRDDRGPGWCLYRRNDHPLVDFSRIPKHDAVTFVHANGFVAKTAEMGINLAIGMCAFAIIGKDS